MLANIRRLRGGCQRPPGLRGIFPTCELVLGTWTDRVYNRPVDTGLIRRCSMFDSLADQIRHDEQAETTPRARLVRYTLITVISVVVFVGIYMGVRMAS